MIGRTNGGGMGLNFKVLGGTAEPAEPKENTIWVNTAAEIISWDFSAEEPHGRSKNKNLNVYPYCETSKTTNGITFTDNGDGTITASGTTSDSIAYFACSAQGVDKREFVLTPGTYTLSGGLTNVVVSIRCTADDWATNLVSCDSQSLTATFTIKQPVKARLFIAVPRNTTLTNAVIKPQLEKGAAATDFVKGDATGQVWIQIGTSSMVPFNALKKNGVMVYPLAAKQYIGGAWVNKVANSYQNGAWIGWAKVVFDRTAQTYDSIYNGLRCTDGDKEPTSTSAPVTDADPFVKMTEGSSSNVHRAWQWEEAINFSEYKTLEVYGYSTDGFFSIDDYLLGVGDVYDMGNVAKMEFAKTEQLHTMDVSGINIVGYIGFLSRNSNASTYVKYVRLLR